MIDLFSQCVKCADFVLSHDWKQEGPIMNETQFSEFLLAVHHEEKHVQEQLEAMSLE